MQKGTTDVKSRRKGGETKIVGEAKYNIYDSVEEAVSTIGPEKVLEYVNALEKTNEMNRIRGSAVGKPSKKYLEGLAFSDISAAEWQQIAGDPEAIRALLDKKIAAIEARMANVPADDGDDDEDLDLED